MRPLICTVFALFASGAHGQEWPDYAQKSEWVTELNERYAGRSGTFHDTSYPQFLANYEHDGDYLNWGKLRAFRDDNEIVMHESGLPQVWQDEEPYWNAVVLAHFGLTMHGRIILGDLSAEPMFWRTVDKLIELQRADGGFPYPARPHKDYLLEDGWVSAMAQGQVLSVFARALQLRRDERVVEAGELAFRNLMTPVAEGGTFSTMADLDVSLSEFLFFPEYPSDPVDYTLNGYIFCLLGVYDWSKTDSKSAPEAAEVFKKGVETTEHIIHYFDVDGFSTYDLGHIVLGDWPYVSAHYLGIHVYLLHALHSITNVERFKKYEIKWADKIDQMNKPLRLTTIVVEPDVLSAGEPVTIQVGVSGGSEKPAEFRLAVKQGNVWTDISEFSTATNLKWTPKESGEFILGISARNVGSQTDYDNFRYQSVTVE